MAGFQKVATFKINENGKQGGNVAAYFCTPDGRVLHAVAGPVLTNAFLREARWANETYQLAQLEHGAPNDLQEFFRQAHLERLRAEHHVRLPRAPLPRADSVTSDKFDRLLMENAHAGLDNQGKVHLLLAMAGTPRLEQVYRVVFERILQEKISSKPVAIAGEK